MNISMLHPCESYRTKKESDYQSIDYLVTLSGRVPSRIRTDDIQNHNLTL